MLIGQSSGSVGEAELRFGMKLTTPMIEVKTFSAVMTLATMVFTPRFSVTSTPNEPSGADMTFATSSSLTDMVTTTDGGAIPSTQILCLSTVSSNGLSIGAYKLPPGLGFGTTGEGFAGLIVGTTGGWTGGVTGGSGGMIRVTVTVPDAWVSPHGFDALACSSFVPPTRGTETPNEPSGAAVTEAAVTPFRRISTTMSGSTVPAAIVVEPVVSSPSAGAVSSGAMNVCSQSVALMIVLAANA